MKKLTILFTLILACLLVGTMLASCSNEETDADESVDSGDKVETCVHSFGKWVILKEATCTEDGYRERYCYYCTEKLSQVIPAIQHNWAEATCLSVKTCSNCLLTEGVLAEHTPVLLKAVKQTCEKEGLTEGVQCKVCEKILVAQEVIPAHTREVVKGYSSTCEATGLTDGERCTKCKKTLVEQQVISMCEPVTYEGLKSTCVDFGLTKGAYCSCEKCQRILSGHATIPLIPHTYDKDDYCTTCKNKKPTNNISYSKVDGELIAYVTSTFGTGDIVISPTYGDMSVVVLINNYAFDGKTGLTGVVIPNTLEEIGYGAFANCTGLKSITFANDAVVAVINADAFSGCASLESFTIPASVVSIGVNAFEGCTALIKEEKGVYYVDNWAIGYNAEATEIVLRDTTVGIADNAFEGCNIKTMVIPSSVAYIGKNAFKDCVALEKINLPSGLTKISAGVFSGCKALASVTLPQGIKEIGNSAFYNCAAFDTITIPANVSVIGIYAFKGCYNLTSVTFENVAGWYTVDGTNEQAIYVNVSAENPERLYLDYTNFQWVRKAVEQGE